MWRFLNKPGHSVCSVVPGSVQLYIKVKRNRSNQNSSSAIKTKREITKIINSQNTKNIFGQTNKQLFPKRWPLSNPKRTKDNINTRTW